MKYEAIAIALLSCCMTLVAVFIGSDLNRKNTIDLFYFKQNIELQVRSYSKLMGIKHLLAQATMMNLEAKMLCEFYETRYLLFGKVPGDIEEAKRQNDRAISLIPMIANAKKELSEAIASVQISYEHDPELERLIEKAYNIPAVELTLKDRSIIKTESDLDTWKNATIINMKDLVKNGIQGPIEKLLNYMKYNGYKKAGVKSTIDSC